MKNICTFMLIFIITFTCCTNICIAESTAELTSEESQAIDSEISKIIDAQLSDEEKDILKSTKELGLSDEPIIKIYGEIYWSVSGNPLNEIIAVAEQHSSESYNYTDYYVLSAVPYRISVVQNKVGKIDTEKTPQYIKDIYKLSSQVTVNEKKLDVKGIYCFDADTSYNGIVVYIMTTEEALVKYYENADSEAVLFSESKFQIYGRDYYSYITSYDYNYNENGNPTGGSMLSFKEFINSGEWNIVDSDKNHTTDGEVSNILGDPALGRNNQKHLIWLYWGFLLVIVATIIVYGIHKSFYANKTR